VPDPVASVLASPYGPPERAAIRSFYNAWKINPEGPPILGGLSDFCPKRGSVPGHSSDERGGWFRSGDSPSTLDLRPMILLAARARQGDRQVGRRVCSTCDETCIEIVAQPGVTSISRESSATERSSPSLTGIQ